MHAKLQLRIRSDISSLLCLAYEFFGGVLRELKEISCRSKQLIKFYQTFIIFRCSLFLNLFSMFIKFWPFKQHFKYNIFISVSLKIYYVYDVQFQFKADRNKVSLSTHFSRRALSQAQHKNLNPTCKNKRK